MGKNKKRIVIHDIFADIVLFNDFSVRNFKFKVRTFRIFGGGGCQVAIIFYLNNGEWLRADVTESGNYLIGGPNGEDAVSLLPLFGDGFWGKLLAK